MTYTIAILNQKGGVGKTTTAITLSACLANLGYRTLIIDADAQANATLSLGINADNIKETFYNFLISDLQITKVIKDTEIVNLSILPSNQHLYAADIDLFEMNNKHSILKNKFEVNEIKKLFDFIIIDCPPHLGPLTINIMNASDKIIIPLKPDYLSLKGLSILLNTYTNIKNTMNNNLAIIGILLTMYTKNTILCRDIENDLKKTVGSLVFDTRIPQNIALAVSPSHGKPVTSHEPGSTGSISYINFTKELLKRLSKEK